MITDASNDVKHAGEFDNMISTVSEYQQCYRRFIGQREVVALLVAYRPRNMPVYLRNCSDKCTCCHTEIMIIIIEFKGAVRDF